MMKLYYAPGACSMSCHIALREAGLPFDLEKVDLKAHRTESGADFWKINPKGYVPLLQLDSGDTLTENAAILQYVGDQVPGKRLVPEHGTFARYQLQAWLSFISTELHKQLGPLLHGASGDAGEKARAKVGQRLQLVSEHLVDRPFLMGESFSVADGYLFVMTMWCAGVKIDRKLYPNLDAHFERTRDRPAVHAVLEAEGQLDRARGA